MATDNGENVRKRTKLLLPVMLLGDTNVGKTCLAHYCEAQSSTSGKQEPHSSTRPHIPTIGMDYAQLTRTIDDQVVKFQIWDTAGQERFHTITPHYYRNASIILVMYDVTSVPSFDGAQRHWLPAVDEHARPDAQKMLVANKIDLQDRRVVTREQGVAAASRLTDVRYAEISARTGQNVDALFVQLYRMHELQRALHDDDGGVRTQSIRLSVSCEAEDNAEVMRPKTFCCSRF